MSQVVIDAMSGYSIEKLIGTGGMSDVYQAVQNRLGRKVALKVRRRHQPEHDAKLRERFIQSVRLHSTMNHPNIVRVIDLLNEGGRDVAVLELLNGQTLDQMLKSKHRLSLLMVIQVATELGSALEYIHARGVVHRDVKPSNMMFADEGSSSTLKLMDFGVAKEITQDTDLTVKGANIGTLWYMPPEQLSGQQPGPSWDLFALGVSLAELWLGQLPLQERSQSAVFRRHLDGESIPAWPKSHFQQCPELCDVLEGMLEIEPTKRLKDLAVFGPLISAIRNKHGGSASDNTCLPQIEPLTLNRNLSGLSEVAVGRLKRLLNHQSPTQEITLSVDRGRFENESVATDLDETVLTDSVLDE